MSSDEETRRSIGEKVRIGLAMPSLLLFVVGCAVPDPVSNVDLDSTTAGDADTDSNASPDDAATDIDANQDADSGADSNTASDTDGDPESDVSDCGGEYLSEWPADSTPEKIGKKLAALFKSQLSGVDTHYKQACTWYGSLSVAALLGEQSLMDSLIAEFSGYMHAFDVNPLSTAGHVDQNVFGIVPFEISLHEDDADVLDLGVRLADHQIAHKDDPDQKRYAVDDMFMITGLQVQAYRATGDNKYLDFAAATMAEYLDRLQEDDGCFHHLEGNSIRWGRGNGWFAAGMAEILRELQPGHEHYPRIRKGYEDMMKGLLDYQIQSGEGAGLWNQVLDSLDQRNWPETSGSAMFTAAMATGVRNCWIDGDTYGPVARKAWLALVDHLESDGRLRDVSNWCYFTGGDALSQYLERNRITGDNHGQAPMLWSAAALLR